MTVINPPLGLQTAGIKHPANLVRQMVFMLSGVEGVSSFTSDDLKVTASGTPAMNVHVSQGGALIKGDDLTGQGLYVFYNDGDVTLTVPAADVTNPRIDLVVARVKDTTAGQTGDTSLLDYIAGTPAGSPVAPALPNTALLLAQVAVAANAASITNANITDKRVKLSGGIDSSQQFQIQPLVDTTNHGLGSSEVTVYSFTAGLPTGWGSMDIYILGFISDGYVSGSGFRRVFGQLKLDGTSAPVVSANYFDTDFGGTALAREVWMFNYATGKTANVAVTATNWETGGSAVYADHIQCYALKLRRS